MLNSIASPTCRNKFPITIFDLSNSSCLRGSLNHDTHGRRNPRKLGATAFSLIGRGLDRRYL